MKKKLITLSIVFLAIFIFSASFAQNSQDKNRKVPFPIKDLEVNFCCEKYYACFDSLGKKYGLFYVLGKRKVSDEIGTVIFPDSFRVFQNDTLIALLSRIYPYSERSKSEWWISFFPTNSDTSIISTITDSCFVNYYEMWRDYRIFIEFINENFDSYKYWNNKESFTFQGKKLKGEYSVRVLENGKEKEIKKSLINQCKCKMLRPKIKYHYN